jgi:hypothetical protein
MAISPDKPEKTQAVEEAARIISNAKHSFAGWGNPERMATVNAVLINSVGAFFLPEYISPFQLHTVSIGLAIYSYLYFRDYTSVLSKLMDRD